MCKFHGSNGNGFGDMWWTDKCTYFSSIDGATIGRILVSNATRLEAYVNLNIPFLTITPVLMSYFPVIIHVIVLCVLVIIKNVKHHANT